jgi:hypothetical protein
MYSLVTFGAETKCPTLRRRRLALCICVLRSAQQLTKGRAQACLSPRRDLNLAQWTSHFVCTTQLCCAPFHGLVAPTEDEPRESRKPARDAITGVVNTPVVGPCAQTRMAKVAPLVIVLGLIESLDDLLASRHAEMGFLPKGSSRLADEAGRRSRLGLSLQDESSLSNWDVKCSVLGPRA